MHVIHAKRLGESPWGWRPGTVVEVHDDGGLTVAYADLDTPVVAWHHADLTDVLHTGTEVRVHEGYHALAAVQCGWVSLKVKSGAGPVARPADVTPWRNQLAGIVVDLATGRGIDVHAPDLPVVRSTTDEERNSQ